jgi:hypothetical protein
MSLSHLIDCITEATKIKLIAELNKMEWQLGVGGKQQCHVVMACEDTQCPFVTASRYVHRVKKPSATSWYFLAVRCNMIHYVIGLTNKGNFGSHSDACPLLNHNSTAPENGISIGLPALFLPSMNRQPSPFARPIASTRRTPP